MSKLYEDSRKDLIAKSKRGDAYAPDNRQAGKNRQQRRLKSRIANSVKEFNKIDMNKLFKQDILDVNIRVNGETDVYLVQVSFNGFLNSLVGFMKEDFTEDDLDFKIIMKALLDAFNHNDVYVHCTCADWKFRIAYWATVNGINAGEPELRPSDETNPNDTKGAGCKHVNLVLNNNSWMMKVAAVINNYIKYIKTHQEKLYQNVIYPAIFDKEYIPPEDLESEVPDKDLLDTDEYEDDDVLISDEDTIDTSNKWARTKTQFKPGWNKTTNDSDVQVSNSNKSFDIDSTNLDDIEQ